MVTVEFPVLHEPLDVLPLDLGVFVQQIHQLVVLVLNLGDFVKQLLFSAPVHLQQAGYFSVAPRALD